jgi:hypothetical protein
MKYCVLILAECMTTSYIPLVVITLIIYGHRHTICSTIYNVLFYDIASTYEVHTVLILAECMTTSGCNNLDYDH